MGSLGGRRQIGHYGIEQCVQLTTNGRKGRDDGDADESGNEAILDGGGAGLARNG